MTKKKNKSQNHIVAYLLIAMLVAGLGGFGITNFSGGGSAVATVGARDISAQAYYRALSQAVRAQQEAGATDLTFATLQAQGIPAQIQGQLLGMAAIDNEADRLGVSVGDDEVAKVVTNTSAFQGVDGKFDRESYEFTLERNGWSVSEFEQTVREESTRKIIEASVAAGVTTPKEMEDLMTAWFGERRSFRWVPFTPDLLSEPVPAPTDAQLEDYHAAHEADFTLPETKRITYAWLTPEMLAATVEVSADDLHQLYAERADEYVVPERRLVERLVFGTADEATAAREAIESGQKDFATLVEERGLTLEDVDLGEVAEADLGQAGAAIFGLTEPGLVGPYPTDLGPALFRMNGILQPRETSFEDAEPELRAELAAEQARREIEDRIADLDDRLAGGATLEDLVAETEMELGTIDYHDGVEDGIAAYEGIREAAAGLTDRDFPEIMTLDDGSIYAMRLDETLPPRLQPLDEVRDNVAAGWRAETVQTQVMAQAEAAKAALDAGKTLVEAAGLDIKTAENVTRGGFPPDIDPAVLTAVFTLDTGESAVVRSGDGAVLAVLDQIAPADETDAQVTLFRNALNQQTAQTLATDLYNYYTQAVLSSAGLTINDAGLNSVHSQLFR